MICAGLKGSRQIGHSLRFRTDSWIQVQQNRWPQIVLDVSIRGSKHKGHFLMLVFVPFSKDPKKKGTRYYDSFFSLYSLVQMGFWRGVNRLLILKVIKAATAAATFYFAKFG